MTFSVLGWSSTNWATKAAQFAEFKSPIQIITQGKARQASQPDMYMYIPFWHCCDDTITVMPINTQRKRRVRHCNYRMREAMWMYKNLCLLQFNNDVHVVLYLLLLFCSLHCWLLLYLKRYNIFSLTQVHACIYISILLQATVLVCITSKCPVSIPVYCTLPLASPVLTQESGMRLRATERLYSKHNSHEEN